MTGIRPQVGLACTAEVREQYIDDADLERLEKFADFRWQEFEEETGWDAAPEASDAVRKNSSYGWS